ncbi:MAG: hypothetical protein LBT30_04100 [Clostridiales bacterium]|jgi:hypothetical protein|nr:hypothetical protein [Clostridiales bacterium]
MKNALLTLLTILTVYAASGAVFYRAENASYAAEAAYMLIPDDGIILYTIDGNYAFVPLLTLPKTYYLEYTGRSNQDYHIVKYMELVSGLGKQELFVLKGAVSAADTAFIEAPYPSVTVRNALSGEKLYARPASPTVTASIASANSPLKFYGSLEDGGTLWHYVGYNASFGYIKDDALVEPPVVPVHPNSAASIGGGNDTPTDSPKIFTLILTVGIILPALIIFLLMFRPSKRRTKAYNAPHNKVFSARSYSPPHPAGTRLPPRYSSEHSQSDYYAEENYSDRFPYDKY